MRLSVNRVDSQWDGWCLSVSTNMLRTLWHSFCFCKSLAIWTFCELPGSLRVLDDSTQFECIGHRCDLFLKECNWEKFISSCMKNGGLSFLGNSGAASVLKWNTKMWFQTNWISGQTDVWHESYIELPIWNQVNYDHLWFISHGNIRGHNDSQRKWLHKNLRI